MASAADPRSDAWIREPPGFQLTAGGVRSWTTTPSSLGPTSVVAGETDAGAEENHSLGYAHYITGSARDAICGGGVRRRPAMDGPVRQPSSVLLKLRRAALESGPGRGLVLPNRFANHCQIGA